MASKRETIAPFVTLESACMETGNSLRGLSPVSKFFKAFSSSFNETCSSLKNRVPSSFAVIVMLLVSTPWAVELSGRFTLMAGRTEKVVETRKNKIS